MKHSSLLDVTAVAQIRVALGSMYWNETAQLEQWLWNDTMLRSHDEVLLVKTVCQGLRQHAGEMLLCASREDAGERTLEALAQALRLMWWMDCFYEERVVIPHRLRTWERRSVSMRRMIGEVLAETAKERS